MNTSVVKITRKFFSLVLIAMMVPHMVPLAAAARTFKQALPGYVFSFPKDHASHEDFKTEWWYYTGHLKTESGKKFGYELTFFRSGIEHELKELKNARNVYLAHFALTDETGKKFRYFEKMSRSGLPVADARSDVFLVNNQGWSAEGLGDKMVLKADAENCGIHLMLSSMKRPIVHGKDGVSQKASCKGCASHYYSMTRMKTEGTVIVEGKAEKITGLSWMDHEFGSNQLTEEQVGWDWYSIQLDDNSELMLYVMRRKDGSIDKNSAGTIVNADGSIIHLSSTQFVVKSKSSWVSAKSKGKYPMGWSIEIPERKISLALDPVLQEQELVTTRSTGVTYWEGSANVSGTINAKPVQGQSYVEMTGYAEAFRKNI